jgi:two-component system, NarL family, nitrate/nitrite response regulator NarL
MSRIRVLLADDHPLVLDGIRSCLEFYDHIEVVGEAKTGNEALERAEALQPDIVIMDLNMPQLNGLDAMEILRERFSHIRLLVLSMHDSKQYIASALQYGASGYVLKEVPSEELVTAIEAVHRGGTYFSSGVSEILLSPNDEEDIGGPLTTREQNILLLLSEGRSNKEVARELDISVRTVETHRRNIKKKLKVRSTTGLVRYAIEHGLIKVSEH